MKISFIGFGHLAKAMAHSLSINKSNQLRAAAPTLTDGEYCNNVQTFNNNLSVIPNADVLILAVKPKQMAAVLSKINPINLPPHCLVITVASGLQLRWYEKHLPRTAIVRAMPNMAVATKQSATPLMANQWVNKKQKLIAERLFNQLGITTWVDKENDLDAFTALSGSGPAYVFLFMETMISTAITLGLKADIAKKFTLQTFQSALSLADQNTADLSKLRHSVTSPKGTTEAAIAIFKEYKLDEIIEKAMNAAYLRAQELGLHT